MLTKGQLCFWMKSHILMKIYQLFFNGVTISESNIKTKLTLYPFNYPFRWKIILMTILAAILFLCSCPKMVVWHSSVLWCTESLHIKIQKLISGIERFWLYIWFFYINYSVNSNSFYTDVSQKLLSSILQGYLLISIKIYLLSIVWTYQLRKRCIHVFVAFLSSKLQWKFILLNSVI